MSKKQKEPSAVRVVKNLLAASELLFPPLATRLAYYAFFTPLRYPTPEREKNVLASASRISLEVNDQQIEAYTWGEGEKTVLLMHGWSGRATQFAGLIHELTKHGCRVIAADAPGHGRSVGKSSNVFQFADTIHALIQHFGPVDTAIGHSLGGTAVLLAAKRGLPISRAVLIATPAVGDDILEVSRLKMGASKKTMISLKNRIERVFKGSFDSVTASAVARDVHTLPTLLVYDDSDDDAPVKHGELLHKTMINSLFVVSSGQGHTRVLRDVGNIEKVTAFVMT
ncbi:MAG TPA: alpha/beta hydrolase [Luteibaculaceae bacterium]|nr:alpha/beta hydrolase [Luteibaculaceae bacterium]